MVAGDYGRGCGVAPLVTEGTAQESAGLSETSRRAFSEMTDRLAFHFVAFGVDRAAARVLADAVIAGVEGAMITSRALRSPAPYDSVRAVLVSHAATVSPKTASRTRASSCSVLHPSSSIKYGVWHSNAGSRPSPGSGRQCRRWLSLTLLNITMTCVLRCRSGILSRAMASCGVQTSAWGGSGESDAPA